VQPVVGADRHRASAVSAGQFCLSANELHEALKSLIPKH
jgi:hypothetical protein